MPRYIIGAVFAILLLPATAFSPAGEKEGLQWMSLAEVESAMQKVKKPVLIDLYTDWCGWCKVMDQKTYSDKKVISYLQENFYVVKINAETRDKISWQGKSYQFNSSARTNDFAIYLSKGRLAYPTTVIIPANGSDPQPIPGYLTPKQIEVIVKYFGEGKYGKVPFPEYRKDFKGSW